MIFESKLKYEKFYQIYIMIIDYVYQSKAALTASINLMGKINEGGIYVYPKSHKKF